MVASSPGTHEHFDAIVVGSGFGGSVTAARLAEAGWRVCVLERGKAYPPTSFPRSPLGLKHNFWDPSEGLHGMFDLWSFDGIDALCASGLGGGSLIYANVFLRKDEHWFVKEDLAGGGYEDWPVTRAELDPHYDRVEKRVGVLPRRAITLRPDPQGDRLSRSRATPRAEWIAGGVVTGAARRDVRQRGLAGGSGRADLRATQPPRTHAHYVPPVRGV